MLLRLAVWNCNMRFHEKLEAVRLLRPDVLVVPECACPEVLLRRVPDLPASSVVWTGAAPSKGLAVFGFGTSRVEADNAHDPRGRTTLAVRVTGPAAFRLLAVWAGRGGREPLGGAVERLSDFLSASPAAIAGDFNDALAGPSPLARRIEALGFRSAYHAVHGTSHGAEPEATLFVRRRHGIRGHRDLIFLDRTLTTGLRGVTVGDPATWTGASDHAPVVAEIAARFC